MKKQEEIISCGRAMNMTGEADRQTGCENHCYDGDNQDEGEECPLAQEEDRRTVSIVSTNNNNSSSSSGSGSVQRSGDDILNDKAAVSGASRMNKTPHTIATEANDYTVPHVGSFRRHCNVCKQPYPALHTFYHQVGYPTFTCLVVLSLTLSYRIMPYHNLHYLTLPCHLLLHSSTYFKSQNIFSHPH